MHSAELEKDLKFGDNVDLHTREVVTSIINKYWDCFIKIGAKRTILGYEFGIDIGGDSLFVAGSPHMVHINRR